MLEHTPENVAGILTPLDFGVHSAVSPPKQLQAATNIRFIMYFQ